MNEKIDLKEIEQKTFAEFMIDGITEILAGILLIFSPILFLRPYFVVFIPFIILFGHPVTELIRERLVYPRIGRVEFKHEADTEDFSVKKSLVEFLLLILGAILITFTTMFIVEGEIFDLELWYKWFPLLFGLIMFGPSLYLVEKTGNRYNYFFGIFCTLLGLIFSIISIPDEIIGLFLYFIVLGTLILFFGIIKHIRFIRKFPVITIEEE
ncbi:MAG: hypothetical protein ACFE95_02855 [Candidatus Hodarchaeota archaeon]